MPRGALDLRGVRVGAREDNYYAPDFTITHVSLPPNTRVDLSGEISLLTAPVGSVTATLRAENLFDARYTNVAGFNYDFALSDAANVQRTGYRAAGRRVLVGARVGF